jgi:hypothetical protein
MYITVVISATISTWKLYVPSVFCRRVHAICMSFVFAWYSGVQHVLTIWVTWWVSYKRQELLTLREYLSSSSGFLARSVLLIILVFLCCPIMCLYVLSSALWCPLRFPHKNDDRFIFTSSCKGSCLIYVILRLFAYCGVQLLFILCCVFVLFVFVWCLVYPVLSVSLDCPFLIAPSVFSNVYCYCVYCLRFRVVVLDLLKIILCREYSRNKHPR